MDTFVKVTFMPGMAVGARDIAVSASGGLTLMVPMRYCLGNA